MDVASIGPNDFIWAVVSDIAVYRNPTITVDDYVDKIAKAGLPKTAEFILARPVLIEPAQRA